MVIRNAIVLKMQTRLVRLKHRCVCVCGGVCVGSW